MDDKQHIVQLAARVDELEDMIAGLCAYIAVATKDPGIDVNDDKFKLLLQQSAPAAARAIQPVLQKALGTGPIAVPSRGYVAGVTVAAINEAREMAGKAGITTSF